MGDAGEGEGLDEAADAATPEGDDDDNDAGGPRWPVVVVAAIIAGVVLISGVALAAVGGDAGPQPDAGAPAEPTERSTSTTTEPVGTTATSTTLAPTTTAAPAAPVSDAAPTTAAPAARPPRSVPPATQAPAPPRPATCFRPWPNSGAGTLPTVYAGPGKFVAFGPPGASCVDVADGCLVAVTLRWSDGYSEVGSAVVAEPGQYTVNGDRGTTWTFTVNNDRMCTSNGGNYSNVWPPGT